MNTLESTVVTAAVLAATGFLCLRARRRWRRSGGGCGHGACGCASRLGEERPFSGTPPHGRRGAP